MKGDEMEEKSTFVTVGKFAVRRSLITCVKVDTVYNPERRCDEFEIVVFYNQPLALTKYETRCDGKPSTPYATDIASQSIHARFGLDHEDEAKALFDELTR